MEGDFHKGMKKARKLRAFCVNVRKFSGNWFGALESIIA